MDGLLVPVTSLIYFNAKILIYYKENNFTKAYTAMRKLNQNSGARPTIASEINGKAKVIVYKSCGDLFLLQSVLA